MEDDAVLGRDSFQSAEFLQKYPLPDGYPNGAALFSCPPALKGRFWPADSWAWKFVDMFPPSYTPPENTQWQDLFVKEQLCQREHKKKPPSAAPDIQNVDQPCFWAVSDWGQGEVSALAEQHGLA